jgi:hypothetical protein
MTMLALSMLEFACPMQAFETFLQTGSGGMWGTGEAQMRTMRPGQC